MERKKTKTRIRTLFGRFPPEVERFFTAIIKRHLFFEAALSKDGCAHFIDTPLKMARTSSAFESMAP